MTMVANMVPRTSCLWCQCVANKSYRTKRRHFLSPEDSACRVVEPVHLPGHSIKEGLFCTQVPHLLHRVLRSSSHSSTVYTSLHHAVQEPFPRTPWHDCCCNGDAHSVSVSASVPAPVSTQWHCPRCFGSRQCRHTALSGLSK